MFMFSCYIPDLQVHCKAGRSRTGLVVCGYFLLSGLFETSKEAIEYFNKMRSRDAKNVVLPSQVRYVQYYEQVGDSCVELTQNKALKNSLQKFVLDPPSYVLKRVIVNRVLPIEGGTIRCLISILMWFRQIIWFVHRCYFESLGSVGRLSPLHRREQKIYFPIKLS